MLVILNFDRFRVGSVRLSSVVCFFLCVSNSVVVLLVFSCICFCVLFVVCVSVCFLLFRRMILIFDCVVLFFRFCVKIFS